MIEKEMHNTSRREGKGKGVGVGGTMHAKIRKGRKGKIAGFVGANRAYHL